MQEVTRTTIFFHLFYLNIIYLSHHCMFSCTFYLQASLLDGLEHHHGEHGEHADHHHGEHGEHHHGEHGDHQGEHGEHHGDHGEHHGDHGEHHEHGEHHVDQAQEHHHEVVAQAEEGNVQNTVEQEPVLFDQALEFVTTSLPDVAAEVISYITILYPKLYFLVNKRIEFILEHCSLSRMEYSFVL